MIKFDRGKVNKSKTEINSFKHCFSKKIILDKIGVKVHFRKWNLRKTRTVEELLAEPLSLVAMQVYLAECSGAARLILRQHVPFIFVITYSDWSSIHSLSFIQDIFGVGIPYTWHSRTCWVPSGTSLKDRNCFANSGGSTLRWVSKKVLKFRKAEN